MRFQGKVALVTGAASGIGAATAGLLAAEGAWVYCADLDRAGAEREADAVRRSGAAASALALDVTNEDQWSAAVNALVNERGRLDILVNSAGISSAAPLVETSLAEWRRVFAINVDGIFLGLKHALRGMTPGGGSIVNVTSASGVRAAAGAAAYSSSRGGRRHVHEERGQGVPRPARAGTHQCGRAGRREDAALAHDAVLSGSRPRAGIGRGGVRIDGGPDGRIVLPRRRRSRERSCFSRRMTPRPSPESSCWSTGDPCCDGRPAITVAGGAAKAAPSCTGGGGCTPLGRAPRRSSESEVGSAPPGFAASGVRRLGVVPRRRGPRGHGGPASAE